MSRDGIALVILAMCVVAAPVLLIAGYFATEADHDWGRIASVNGVAIDRAHLRNELAFEKFLTAQQAQVIDTMKTAGRIDTAAAETEVATLRRSLGDPVKAAQTDLVDDALVRQIATREGIAPRAVDPWQQLATFLGSAYGRRVRFVSIALPATAGRPLDAVRAAGARAGGELAHGATLATVTAELTAAGLRASGSDRSIGPRDAVDGIDPSLLVAARSAAQGAALGPFVDRQGVTIVGALVDVAPSDPGFADRLRLSAATARIDEGTVSAWAQADVAREDLAALITTRLASTPTDLVRGEELVIGPAKPDDAVSGPWVELAALRIPDLGSGSVPSPSSGPNSLDRFLANLRSRTPEGKIATFRDLASAVIRWRASSAGSGELGYLARGDLAKPVADAVFAPSVHAGDIVGPISVGGISTILLVEARYGGSLDQRASGAMVEARAPGADLHALATRFSPTDASLAVDSGWFARAEFGSDDSAAALFATAKGALSDPVVLENELALVRITEATHAVPSGVVRDRLALTGFATWYGTERAKASITLEENPLPEAYPSASATGSPRPSTSTGPERTMAPFETPDLPTIPGLPSPSAPTSVEPAGTDGVLGPRGRP